MGGAGERFAEAFFCAKGATILDRNWHSRFGELDLVVLLQGIVRGIEVKTRTNEAFGTPAEAITLRKLDRLQKTLLLWQQAHPDFHHVPIALDAFCLTIKNGKATPEWIQDVSLS